MARFLHIRIQVPNATSDEALRLAEAKAKEAAVLVLQQEGEITIGEAALDLGLSYEGYLDLLTEKDLPATNNDTDPAVLDALRQGQFRS